jgi:hypothetical protein
MKTIWRKVLLATAGVFGTTAVLADFDGSEPLLCSLGEIVECDYGAECQSVTNEEVAAPDFIRFDFRKKQFVGITAGISSEPDTIENVQNLDNHLIVQGTQGTSPVDPLGWSMSVNQTTGRATFTASGDDAGFVGFGACTTL